MKRFLCLIGMHYFFVRDSHGGTVMLHRCFHCGKNNPRGGL